MHDLEEKETVAEAGCIEVKSGGLWHCIQIIHLDIWGQSLEL